MKTTDLRAKARAIFGPAIAEPMPKQPNGAKALQQRANARPIPTYKDGGAIKKPTLTPAERKMGDALMMTKKGRDVMAYQDRMEADKAKADAEKRKRADKLLGVTTKKDGGKACGGKMGKYADGGATLPNPLGRASTSNVPVRNNTTGQERNRPTNDSMGASPQERALGRLLAQQKQAAAARLAGKRATAVEKRVGSPIRRAEGGKVQTSSDTARKLATEMGGMKKGGKAKDGLAVMIAIGKEKPVKKAVGGKMMAKMGPAITRAKADLDRMAAMPKVDPRDIKGRPGGGMLGKMMKNPEMRAKFEAAAEKAGVPAPRTAIGYPVQQNPVEKIQYKDGGTPVKKAVGGAGKTRKGQAPIKKAAGGAAKVRKGMMSPTGDIKKVVTPKKGIGGM